MATIPLTAIADGNNTFLWETLTGTDDGAPLEQKGIAGLAGSIQMVGTFGAAVTAQVSNDGTNWATLLDTADSGIAMTAAGLKEFSTAARYIRVLGAGVTDVDVYIRIAS